MEGADSVVSGDAFKHQGHIGARRENIHDQLDQFARSLNTELRDLEKLGVGRESPLNDDSVSDVSSRNTPFELRNDLDSVQSQTLTNGPSSTAIARPRTKNRRRTTKRDTEKSSGRKIEKPRTPSGEVRGRGFRRQKNSQKRQNPGDEKSYISLMSLPFHLRD
jgi:hypothetical protein